MTDIIIEVDVTEVVIEQLVTDGIEIEEQPPPQVAEVVIPVPSMLDANRVPSPTGESDGRMLHVQGGALVYRDPITKADVGLSEVDNTSDAAKPVSTAQQTALDTKLATSDLPTALSTVLLEGSNVSIVFDEQNGTLTIAASGGGGGLTQEQTEDIVAALIDDNSVLDWTYFDNDEAAGSLVATLKDGSVTAATLAADTLALFATAAQGAKADTAVQPEELGTAAGLDAEAFDAAGTAASAVSDLLSGAAVFTGGDLTVRNAAGDSLRFFMIDDNPAFHLQRDTDAHPSVSFGYLFGFSPMLLFGPGNTEPDCGIYSAGPGIVNVLGTMRHSAAPSNANDVANKAYVDAVATAVRHEGLSVGTRRAINFHEGVGVSIDAVDDAANGEVDITINSFAASKLWLPHSTFSAVQGSPTVGLLAGKQPAWLFDASTIEAIGASILLPADWQTFSVTFLWAMVGTTQNNVRWELLHAFYGAGDTADNAATIDGVVVGSAAQYVVVSTAVVNSIANQPGKMFMCRPRRKADDAADNMAGDAALLGVELTRLT